MSFDPRNPSDLPESDSSQGSSRPRPSGSQGASRGGQRPEANPNQGGGNRSDWRAGGRQGTDPSRIADWIPKGGGSRTFLGLPLALIYAIGVSIIGLVFLGAVCSKPVANGSVAGQIKALTADQQVSTLAGAQVVLRGPKDTYTAVSTDVPADATGEAAYNYRFENVPAGTYTMAVTPPAGAGLQSEDNISLKVESGQLFPQSVMLLADGIQKPTPLAQGDLPPGETGYVNGQGQRVTYQEGSGFSPTDALLLYLLWRNPPSYGYGAPPIIVTSPGGFTTGSSSSTTSSPSYRVDPPPTTSRNGEAVTQRPPSVAGQGSTRPSSATGATGSTGAGPSYSSSGASTSSGSSGSSSSGATTSRPSGGTSSSPSQGISRPSSSAPSVSRPSVSAPSRSSGSSGGGRR